MQKARETQTETETGTRKSNKEMWKDKKTGRSRRVGSEEVIQRKKQTKRAKFKRETPRCTKKAEKTETDREKRQGKSLNGSNREDFVWSPGRFRRSPYVCPQQSQINAPMKDHCMMSLRRGSRKTLENLISLTKDF